MRSEAINEPSACRPLENTRPLGGTVTCPLEMTGLLRQAVRRLPEKTSLLRDAVRRPSEKTGLLRDAVRRLPEKTNPLGAAVDRPCMGRMSQSDILHRPECVDTWATFLTLLHMSATKKAASKKAASKKTAPQKPAPKKPTPAPKHTRGKHSKLAAPAPPSPPPPPAVDPPFLTQDPAEAFQHFRSAAQAVPAAGAKRLNIDPDIVVNNTGIALAAFAPIKDAVQAAVPGAPVNRFLEVGSLALALLYASDQVVVQASKGEIASRLAALNVLRAPMLLQLEVLANPVVGLADPDRVKAIRAGAGPLDKAHDAVNIAAYYQELGPAVAGKHPFTGAQLADLAAAGQWLVQQLTPSGAVHAPSPTDPAAVLRDQMWTLLSARYDALRAAASVVLGLQDLDQHLPPLGTRVAHAKKAAAAAPPALAAPPVPAGAPAPGAPHAPGAPSAAAASPAPGK
jgi:hypothetical protein